MSPCRLLKKMVAPQKALSSAMNAKIIGSGNEAMILAHGYGLDQSVWHKILPVLAQHYKVLVFDWTFAAGVKDPDLFDPVKYSSYDAFADDLIALADEFRLKSSVFMGHSMSGMVGCIASIKRPDLFKRLILVGASPRYLNTEGYEGGFENKAIDDLLANIEYNQEKWATSFASHVIDSKDTISFHKLENYLTRMRLALPLANIVFHSDHRDTLDKVKTPCNIIQTTNDIVVPNSVAYYMQDKIKGKPPVHIIDTFGHFPQLTAHLQLLDILRQVLGF